MKLSAAAGPLYEIVGVVPDGKYVSLTEEQHPYMYLPWLQTPRPRVTLHVRAAGAPSAVAGPVRAALRSVNSDVPALAPRTCATTSTGRSAASAWSRGCCSSSAASRSSVAAVGVYGLTAYTVAQRRKELGVRVALGARPADLIRLLVSQSLVFVSVGLLAGTGAALLLSRLVASMLFGVTASDPLSFGAGACLLALTTLAAALIPARHATRVDPLGALRGD